MNVSHSYELFQKEKIEELQNNLQALIDITELLIQHVHIITAIPTSFINQLRRFNDIKMADNSKVNFAQGYQTRKQSATKITIR